VKRASIGKRMRFEILKRDGFRCAYCGETSATAQLVVDHVRAVAAGGTSHSGNLITACVPCNSGKSDLALPVAAALEIEATLATRPAPQPLPRGRPPTDPATHRSETVLVRLTPAQRAEIDAVRGDVSIGVWIRAAVLEEALAGVAVGVQGPRP
jgi:hypothetical protein